MEEDVDKGDSKDIVLNNSNFVINDVNWFNVCLGMELLDPGFEYKVNSEIERLGLVIDKEVLLKNIHTLMQNPKVKDTLKSAIHTRLLACTKKPKTFMDTLLNRISFDSCTSCDLRDKGALLYLYDEYKPIMNSNIDGISTMDITIILIYCETRQRLLSYYISLEILRRKNDPISYIKGILKKIYRVDKVEIKKNEEALLQRRLVEEEQRKKQLINNILNDEGKSNTIDFVMEDLLTKDDNTDNFIEEQNNYIQGIENKEDIFKGGGSESKMFSYTKDYNEGICNKVNRTKNIYHPDINHLEDCTITTE